MPRVHLPDQLLEAQVVFRLQPDVRFEPNCRRSDMVHDGESRDEFSSGSLRQNRVHWSGDQDQ